MEALTLASFKSYKKHSLNGFSPFINVIMGGNGQGKSNIFKALSFVLSDKLQINRTQFNNCLHRGVDLNNQSNIQVQVVIREKPNGSQLVKVAKLWKADLIQQCYVNSKLTNKKQYQNFIQSLSISYSNPYNIIQQGKINQITLMDQFELFKLLQQITGAKKFNKRKEQALAIMKKIDLQKEQTKTVLAQLDQKLKSLEGKKEEFQFFAIEQKTKKYRTKKHLTELLEGTRHNLQKIKGQYSQINQSYTKLISKKKKIYQQLEEGAIFIRNAKQKMILIDKTTAGLGPTTQVMQTQQIKTIQQKQKQLNKQLKEYAKKIKEKDQLINTFKKQFAEVEQNYESMKLSKQVNKPNQSREKIIAAYNLQIKSQQDTLKRLEGQRQKLVQKVQQLEKTLKSKKNTQIQSHSQKLQKQLSQTKQKIQLNKKQLSQLNWQKNVQNVQCQSLKQVLNQSQIKLRKYLPYLDFTLMDHLKNAKVKGVYGYFLQFIKIDENARFAYQIAGINKLCSLLVEDQSACSAVIDMNKKIKGRQVNIIQLNFIRDKPADSQSGPKSDSVKKLSNSKWIKVDLNALQDYPDSLSQDLQKLIKNTFARYALVKDYQTGLKASKEYHLNCITSDRQIIYSEGYHCKLGQQNFHYESNLQMFYKFQQKRQFYGKKILQKKQIESRILHIQNQDINLYNIYQQTQIQKNKSSNNVNQLRTQRKMLQVYKKNIEQMDKNYSDNENAINKKKQAIKIISSKNTKGKQSNRWTKAQSEKIEQQYHQKRKYLNKMLTQVYQIEEIMHKLSSDKQEIDNKVINAKNNKAAGIIDPNVIAHEIDSSLQQKQREMKNLQNELEDLNRAEKEVQSDKNHIQIKLITYRAEQQDIMTKLNEIGQIDDDIEELQQLSHSMSISNIHGRKKNHFSAKDKLLFNKFANILESFSSHKKTFKELEQAQQKIKRTIIKYENQSESYLGQITTKFQKQFIDIFGFLVNQGNAQVRFKKISQKVKEVIRYKNCITVKVSFNRQSQPLKKWNDFSGGEKTVVAISMILALQRCQPAPFYVLDQIDSALDSVYVQKIAELLARQSQRNKCQYFISTFKQEMLNFPEQICNYYLVTCQNRVSQVQKIRKSKTVDILRSITMRN